MKMGHFIQLFLILLFGQLLFGCVGKIEEAAAPQTIEFTRPKSLFNYDGIVRATPIAHNKVEIIFQKVPITDSLNQQESDFYYKLFINGDKDGLEIVPDTLSTHEGGNYYYIANNLERNTFYTFKVRAFNRKTGAESKNEVPIKTKTFSDIVSDFMGISQLELAKGQESTAVNVTFSRIGQPVVNTGTPLPPYSPVRIEIFYDTTINGLLSNPTHKKIIQHNEVSKTLLTNYKTTELITGLRPGYDYYFRVRAIHRLYQNNETDDSNPYPKELNTKILHITTKGSSEPLGTAPGNIILKNATRFEGYTAVDVSWSAPTGTFLGYKLAYTSDPTDNLNSISNLGSPLPTSGNMTSRGLITISDRTQTSRKVTGLISGHTYQFRLFICRDNSDNSDDSDDLDDCDVANQNHVEAFDVKSIRVLPRLAAFTGIHRVVPPRNLTEFNNGTISLEFSPPAVSIGWADTMEFKSGPTDDSLTLCTAASTGLCLETTPPVGNALASFSSIKVRGVNFCSPTPQEYCFNATPVLNGSPFLLPPSDPQYPSNNLQSEFRRCFYPEIPVPTIEQFSGLKDYLSVLPSTEHPGATPPIRNSVTATWDKPTGGLYNSYVIFWKKKNSNTRFNFELAKNQYSASSPTQTCNDATSPGYCWHEVLDENLESATITSELDFGTYEFGILPLLGSTGCATKRWGQSNVNIQTVTIPLPPATFKSWTRIFAIGPSRSALRDGDNKFVREAIDRHGVPYEPPRADFDPNGDDVYLRPPGSSDGALNTPNFDGKLDSHSRVGSKEGIVSLAWEEVDLGAAGSNVFESRLSQAESSRSNRKFGYKVFRSEDNGLTWADLTPTNGSGLIKSIDYTHRNRPNINEVNPRMVFFTDYSVSQPTPSDNLNEQARIYWYKIEVHYDGKKLAFTNPKNAMVRVTLPPPNMALVHRWMANRAQCLELNLTPDITKHYACDYNGLGAVPKTSPFIPESLATPPNTKTTKIDMGGDLLVDRYELGCNYTRGPKPKNDQEELKALIPNNFDDVKLRSESHPGCYKMGSISLPGQNEPTSGVNAPTDSNPEQENRLRIGDCVGSHVLNISPSYCASDAQTTPGLMNYFAPGYNGTLSGCDTYYASLLAGVAAPGQTSPPNPLEWSRNNLAQARPLSVYYNRNPGQMHAIPITVQTRADTLTALAPAEEVSGCAINLAAIHNNKEFSRWANLSLFKNSNGYGIRVSKKPNELTSPFYGNILTKPSSLSDVATPIGRIMTSNDADLPPVTNIVPDVAEDLCETYKVDLVFQKGAGTVVSTKRDLQKRLLRRREFVAATLWPETYNANEVRVLEGLLPTTPPAVRNGFLGKSCVHVDDNSTQLNLWAETPRRLSSFALSGGVSSGVSSTDAPGSRCFSRFGIQHLIGNVMEVNTDRLFCDYNGAELRFGTEYNRSFPIDFFSKDHRGWLISSSITVTNLALPSSSYNPIDNFEPFVQPGDDSGYCSMVDTDADHRSNLSSYRAYETFINKFFKILNPALVTSTEIRDRGGVSFYRDGEGYFLDFGPNHLSNHLKQTNSLSLPWSSPGGTSANSSVRNLNLYFSTLMGITMTCGGNSLGVEVTHNCLQYSPKVIEETTSLLLPDKRGDTSLTLEDIQDFFTGGSQIKNLGIQSLKEAPTIKTFAVTDETEPYQHFQYITGIVVNNSSFSYDNFNLQEENYVSANPLPGQWSITSGSTQDLEGTLYYYNPDWELPRNSKLRYFSGGNSRPGSEGERYNGRFSLSIRDESRNPRAGVRCAVKLYEDEE